MVFRGAHDTRNLVSSFRGSRARSGDAFCGVSFALGVSCQVLFYDDDDELIVRASAVLKSQGPENWSRGRPGEVLFYIYIYIFFLQHSAHSFERP